jgi:hypothetical protein
VLRDLRAAPAGPTRVHLVLRLQAQGALKDPQVAALGGQPITLTVDGPVDARARRSDVTLELAAGPLAVSGALRQLGDRAWLRFERVWYHVPPSRLPPALRGALDPQALLRALGGASALVGGAEVTGSDTVDGVAVDRVEGRPAVAALARRLAQAVAGLGQSLLGALGRAGAAELPRTVDRAHATLGVGRDDHVLHQLDVHLRGTTHGSSGRLAGLQGYTVDLDATQHGTDAVTVVPPPSPRPFAQLSRDVGGLFGSFG